MDCWYLVQTKPSGESTAASNLERQGYEVYYPRLIRTVRRAGYRREAVVPLFPRYLFVRLSNLQQSLAPVRSTLGVAGVVRFGLDYAMVPSSVVHGLICRADPVSGLHRLNVSKSLPRGARIRIAEGVFRGLEGLFERDLGVDRVLVLLQLLGRPTSIAVPTDCVVPA
jgi:transcriptional antiterminator RfaH